MNLVRAARDMLINETLADGDRGRTVIFIDYVPRTEPIE